MSINILTALIKFCVLLALPSLFSHDIVHVTFLYLSKEVHGEKGRGTIAKGHRRMLQAVKELVSSPDPTPERGEGSGD